MESEKQRIGEVLRSIQLLEVSTCPDFIEDKTTATTLATKIIAR
jgi:hypothetical protein